MRDRPFAFICSPYRGDVKNNVKMAQRYCLEVFNEGFAPIAPHLLFPQFLSDGDNFERDAGIDMGIALLKLCRVLVVCGDDLTDGMAKEIYQAKALYIPVVSLGALPLL